MSSKAKVASPLQPTSAFGPTNLGNTARPMLERGSLCPKLLQETVFLYSKENPLKAGVRCCRPIYTSMTSGSQEKTTAQRQPFEKSEGNEGSV